MPSRSPGVDRRPWSRCGLRGGRHSGDVRARRGVDPPRRTLANVGVHGNPVSLHLEKLWIKDVTITTGLVDTFSIPRLMRLIVSGRLDPSLFATHRFPLDDTMAAYDTFADAANTGAGPKVVLYGTSTAPAPAPIRARWPWRSRAPNSRWRRSPAPRVHPAPRAGGPPSNQSPNAPATERCTRCVPGFGYVLEGGPDATSQEVHQHSSSPRRIVRGLAHRVCFFGARGDRSRSPPR